jgi:hypothetical protein
MNKNFKKWLIISIVITIILALGLGLGLGLGLKKKGTRSEFSETYKEKENMSTDINKYENFKNYSTTKEIDHKEKNNKNNVCVIMTGDENIRSFYEKTIQKNLNYAKKHGYDFYALIGRRLSDKKYKPHFDRYQIIIDKLNNNYDYVLYIDSDAFIKSQDKSLDVYIEMLNNEPNKIILASTDCMILERKMPINSGVILIKNNEKAKQFCKDVLTLHPEHHFNRNYCNKCPTKFFDQCVIEKLHKYHDSILLLPYGKLQKFPSSITNGPCNSKSDFSKPEFIFHIAGGGSSEERLKILNDEIEGFSNVESFPSCKKNEDCLIIESIIQKI